jgi:hypothetical protein
MLVLALEFSRTRSACLDRIDTVSVDAGRAQGERWPQAGHVAGNGRAAPSKRKSEVRWHPFGHG